MNRYCLLLTACIQPDVENNNFLLNKSDPQVRLEEYKNQLIKWLSIAEDVFQKVIWIENSGYHIKEIEIIFRNYNIHHRQWEILQYKEVEKIPGVHYGYFEFKMLDFAVKNSKIVLDSDFIIKSTGRLYFPEIESIVKFHKLNTYDFFCDSRNYKILGFAPQRYIVTTLLIFNLKVYKNFFLDNHKMMLQPENYYLEHALWNIVDNINNSDKIKLRFPFNVEPEGISGSSGQSYNSLENKIKSNLRGISRKLFPNFHI